MKQPDSAKKSTDVTDPLRAGRLALFPDQKHGLFLAFPTNVSKQSACLYLCPSATDFHDT
jgi:hypothetical protein